MIASVVVCTRNRGDRIVPTIRSILDNELQAFELIVVDQSDDDVTEQAIRSRFDDPRIRYFRSSQRGLGRARNEGLRYVTTENVAFTDDDVTVPSGWLGAVVELLDDHADVGVGYFDVVAAPHDERAGFVPTYECGGEHVATGALGKNRARGIGAGMFVRRRAVAEIGGFDALLGAGGKYSSCEDGDVALRALLAGWHVIESNRVAVVHDGFRTWAEGRALTQRDWAGIGAAYAKPIKAGRLSAVPVVAYEGVYRALIVPLKPILRGRRPQGLKRFAYFWAGFWRAMTTEKIDREKLTFIEG